MSMRTTWTEDGIAKSVTAPVSLIVSAFAPVADVRATLTPLLRRDGDATALLLIDIAGGRRRLGGSALAQVYGQLGDEPADLDAPELLAAFFELIQRLRRNATLLAYHDVADGGLFVALVEMAFASRCGLEVALDGLDDDPLGALFAEELGAVVQVRAADSAAVVRAARDAGLVATIVGAPSEGTRVRVQRGGTILFDEDRVELHRAWSATSHALQRLRDNPADADREYARLFDRDDPGMSPQLTFDPQADIAAPLIATGARPRIAILREQGVNGQVEMAAAFDRAGFIAVDLHMTDLIDGGATLAGFHGLVACGGFSYGDVLGAGEGWAKSILFNAHVRALFEAWFREEGRYWSMCRRMCRTNSSCSRTCPRRPSPSRCPAWRCPQSTRRPD
jgi:phosphoribosylformylglycinamidine synthase